MELCKNLQEQETDPQCPVSCRATESSGVNRVTLVATAKLKLSTNANNAFGHASMEQIFPDSFNLAANFKFKEIRHFL